MASNPVLEDDPAEVFTSSNPFELFDDWMKTAAKNEPDDPTALALATVDPDGMPNVRMVLLKGVGPDGFVFYTNLKSQKGQEILSSGKAALCFHWKSIRRQIRVRGLVEQVSDEEADAYFGSRAKDSQIGAWASRQSQPLESRFALEKEVARYAAKFAVSKVDRPPHWSGFRLKPVSIEFWRNRAFRLHDRVVFRRTDPETSNWTEERLFP
ncbi:MAG: pyridoxamine 5'-phosphate oxidase [Alphaproteobacteria bacterium]|nr:MAG: pyridoxamine 5'-phosphate oxidase [Alphaproteobacteria bacterium]